MTVPFLLDQRLSLLDLGHSPLTHLDVAAAEKRRDRGGFQPEGKNSPWKDLTRADWQARVTADLRRVVLVADAGLGKTSNCEWMAATLPRVHRGLVPFLLPIEKLPESVNDSVMFGALLEQWRLAKECSEAEFPRAKAERILFGLRAAGRLVLVLDSVDQAVSKTHAVNTLRSLLADQNWKACPMVVSTRPHALTSQWDTVFKPVAGEFRFVRVEEMDEKQQRHLLGTIPGEHGKPVSRYELIPAEGRRLLGVPRVIELVRNLGTDRAEYANLNTMTDVYWKCVNEMLLEGLKAKKAGNEVEWNVVADGEVPEEFREVQRDIARNLFGAVAFRMMTADRERPNLAFVPRAECSAFLRQVSTLIQSTRTRHRAEGRDDELDGLGCESGYKGFLRNFTAVTALNSGQMDSYLTDAAGRRNSDLKFRNPTMQAFFAAVWVCRHGTPDDIERLKGWVFDPDDEPYGQYAEFWRFVSELGGTGAWDATAVRGGWWEEVIGVVYRHRTRMCEFIYRSWERVEELNARAMAVYLAEWPSILAGESGEEKQAIALEFMSGFVNVPACDSFRSGPLNGLSLRGGLSSIPAFQIHRYTVMNREYELFDPAHIARRWGEVNEFKYLNYRMAETDHPLVLESGKGADDLCPVVNVNWWEAWCFARWIGAELPTAIQWEYACRAGNRTSEFPTGNRTADLELVGWCTTNANGMTHPVGLLKANAFGLHDMHGNVNELCLHRRDPADTTRFGYGGSWLDTTFGCKADSEQITDVWKRSGNDRGFRVVRGSE